MVHFEPFVVGIGCFLLKKGAKKVILELKLDNIEFFSTFFVKSKVARLFDVGLISMEKHLPNLNVIVILLF